MNCKCKTLNITQGTDVSLLLRLLVGYKDEGQTGDPFPIELAEDVAVQMVSERGERVAVDFTVGDAGRVLLRLKGADFRVGVYGVDVTCRLNGAAHRAYGDSVIRYTFATVKGAESVTVGADPYDVTLYVGYVTDIVPKRTSELVNDGDDGEHPFVSEEELAAVATSGSYNDLKDKPSLDFIPSSQKGAAGGVATLNDKKKVWNDQLNFAWRGRFEGDLNALDTQEGIWGIVGRRLGADILNNEEANGVLVQYADNYKTQQLMVGCPAGNAYGEQVETYTRRYLSGAKRWTEWYKAGGGSDDVLIAHVIENGVFCTSTTTFQQIVEARAANKPICAILHKSLIEPIGSTGTILFLTNIHTYSSAQFSSIPFLENGLYKVRCISWAAEDIITTFTSIIYDAMSPAEARGEGTDDSVRTIVPSMLKYAIDYHTSGLVDGGAYNSETKKIELKHGDTVVSEIDAAQFIVDGMVEDVRIENGNLVIDFNTASGKQDIEIPLTDIFDPNNYYDKTEADEKFQPKGNYLTEHQDISGKQDLFAEYKQIQLEAEVADGGASAYYNIDLGNLYIIEKTEEEVVGHNAAPEITEIVIHRTNDYRNHTVIEFYTYIDSPGFSQRVVVSLDRDDEAMLMQQQDGTYSRSERTWSVQPESKYRLVIDSFNDGTSYLLKPSLVRLGDSDSVYAKKGEIPDVSGKADASNVYAKSETYNKTEIDGMLDVLSSLTLIPVDELPTASADTMNGIYLIPHYETLKRKEYANTYDIVTTSDIKAPMFLRIKSRASGKYLSGNSTAQELFPLQDGLDATTIFYYDGSRIINYATGKALNLLNGAIWQYADDAPESYFNGDSTGFFDICQNGDNSARYILRDVYGIIYGDGVYGDWQLELVRELPITLRKDGNIYYATFSAPVDIAAISGNVSIHTVTFNGNKADLADTHKRSIPANTGVVLTAAADGGTGNSLTVNALIGNYDGDGRAFAGNGLVGYSAAFPGTGDTSKLFLGKNSENILGFYKLGNGSTSNGFRAYLDTGSQSGSSDGASMVPPKSVETSDNTRDEYVTVKTSDTEYIWEKIGSTEIDLSEYYTKAEVDGMIAELPDKAYVDRIASGDYIVDTMGTLPTYTELTTALLSGKTVKMRYDDNGHTRYATVIGEYTMEQYYASYIGLYEGYSSSGVLMNKIFSFSYDDNGVMTFSGVTSSEVTPSFSTQVIESGVGTAMNLSKNNYSFGLQQPTDNPAALRAYFRRTMAGTQQLKTFDLATVQTTEVYNENSTAADFNPVVTEFVKDGNTVYTKYRFYYRTSALPAANASKTFNFSTLMADYTVKEWTNVSGFTDNGHKLSNGRTDNLGNVGILQQLGRNSKELIIRSYGDLSTRTAILQLEFYGTKNA